MLWDFPSGPIVKNSPANAGDMGLIPGLGIFDMLRGNEAHAPNYWSSCTWGPCSTIREAPYSFLLFIREQVENSSHLPQLEKAHEQQLEKTQHNQGEINICIYFLKVRCSNHWFVDMIQIWDLLITDPLCWRVFKAHSYSPAVGEDLRHSPFHPHDKRAEQTENQQLFLDLSEKWGHRKNSFLQEWRSRSRIRNPWRRSLEAETALHFGLSLYFPFAHSPGHVQSAWSECDLVHTYSLWTAHSPLFPSQILFQLLVFPSCHHPHRQLQY